MINKANNEDNIQPGCVKESGYIDTVDVNVQCHLLIKDKDTGETLVHKRG